MSDLVTVTAYTADTDAHTAKGALDSAGIESAVDAAAAQRVKLRVHNVDALRAGDVLNARCPTLPAEIEEADEDDGVPVCPECGSSEVESSHRVRMFLAVVTLAVAVGFSTGLMQAAFFAIFAAAVFFVVSGRWRCGACGELWD